MGFVLLTGLGLGWLVHRARVQRDAVATIRRSGGGVLYDWESNRLPAGSPLTRYGAGITRNANGKPGWPEWLVDRLGPDFFGDITQVNLGKRATDSDLVFVGRLGKLEELQALSGAQFTDAGLAQLRGLARLRVLQIPSKGLTSGCLADLSGLNRLELLSLGMSKIADADLIHLRNLTKLKLLTLPGPGLTDAGMTNLTRLVELRSLGIGAPNEVTNVGLTSLRDMKGLVRLTLMGCRVTDLEPIRHLSELEQLILSKAPLDDAGLAPVADLKSLKTLALLDAPITDAGMFHLSKLKRLEILNISGTKVTDKGLERLASLGSLKRIMVKGSNVTDAGMASLRMALPKTEVIR